MAINYVSMGMRIRRKRRERHWTQERLAQEADLSLSFLGHIERGTRKASLETVISLCNTLDVSPNYLLEHSLTITRREALSPHRRIALRELVHHLNNNLDEWLADDMDPDIDPDIDPDMDSDWDEWDDESYDEDCDEDCDEDDLEADDVSEHEQG